MQRMNARWRVLSEREQGFSLVELIVAMFILGLILTLLIGIQISSLVTVSEARKREQATAFANEAIERMRAVPWAILVGGLDDNYNDSGANDGLVVGGQLTVDGVTRTVRTSAQDVTQPWEPLFDGTGSNTYTSEDPSIPGVEFTVHSYVLNPVSGDTSVVGIAAVVEWEGRGGDLSRTVIWSEAFRGDACNSAQQAVQPFLTGCQAYFYSEASSGSMSTTVTATTTPPDEFTAPERVDLLYPVGSQSAALAVGSASAVARIESQQVSNASAVVQFGQASVDDANPLTAIVVNGGDGLELNASDDIASVVGDSPADVIETQSSADEPETSASASGAIGTYYARSDYGRAATLEASGVGSCFTGIAADAPCALAKLANAGTSNTGSSYSYLDLGSRYLTLARRMSEWGGTSDSAFAARFAGDPGSAAVGCSSVTDSGCVSAGANRTSSVVRIGEINGSDWDGIANDGLVQIRGAAGCSTYEESVLVQRGFDQTATVPTYERCGSIRYWSGGSYVDVAFNENTSTQFTSDTVTSTNAGLNISATATVRIEPGIIRTSGSDALCEAEECTVTVDGGVITVDVSYVIESGVDGFTVTASTVLGSMRASATYKEVS